jgi:hypothetical protein
MGARRVVRLSAADAGVPAGRIVGALIVRAFLFYLVSILVGGLFFIFALARRLLFFAGYTVLHSSCWRPRGYPRPLRLRELRLGGVFAVGASRRWQCTSSPPASTVIFGSIAGFMTILPLNIRPSSSSAASCPAWSGSAPAT